jgi:heptose-I-phosphate ethanolaminephosphotransferase
VDARLAHAEFDIPMWIWCSRKYIRQRPEIFREVMASRNKRYMTDALPHMLLYLAGISCPEYKDRLNLLSPAYDETRPRPKRFANMLRILKKERLKKAPFLESKCALKV